MGKFNLRNAHYAMLSVSEEDEGSYGTSVSLLGSVSISPDANGEPESFQTDALGEKLDDKGVLIENAEAKKTSPYRPANDNAAVPA